MKRLLQNVFEKIFQKQSRLYLRLEVKYLKIICELFFNSLCFFFLLSTILLTWYANFLAYVASVHSTTTSWKEVCLHLFHHLVFLFQIYMKFWWSGKLFLLIFKVELIVRMSSPIAVIIRLTTYGTLSAVCLHSA